MKGERAQMTAREQTYLVGPTLSLRAVEEADAACEPSWRQSWFPRALAVAEAKIEEEHTGDEFLHVAVRRADEVIVGSVLVWFDGPWAYASPFAARWLGDDEAGAVLAEIIELMVPFLVDEDGTIAAMVEVPAGLPAVDTALGRIGARFCYRYREAKLYRGQRRDLLGYQYFNKTTAAVFGEPAFTPEGSVERSVSAPAPKQWPRVDIPPAGAVMIGERIYLRMFTPDDGEIMREASLTETETAHDARFPRGAMRMNARYREESEAELPTRITFAIVLRENDELIGRIELEALDLVHRSAETGTGLFRPEHRGKGYGTEAKHVLLTYAFEVLGLHMVWSVVWQKNPRSRAALLKQGYREAGCTPWRGVHHGIPSDDWNFDLLASEWREARR